MLETLSRICQFMTRCEQFTISWPTKNSKRNEKSLPKRVVNNSSKSWRRLLRRLSLKSLRAAGALIAYAQEAMLKNLRCGRSKRKLGKTRSPKR